MKFSDIPGHERTKEKLRNMVADNVIPHALLLEGPSGIGKFAMARALAQYIHCQNRTADGEPCGVCPSCLQHQSFNHIDTYYSFPVVKGTSRTNPVSNDFIGQFREFLGEDIFMTVNGWIAKCGQSVKNAQAQFYVAEATELIRMLNYTTHGSKYMIVLLWLPERMNEETSNKLLKIIEEPFEDTLFIMTSDAPAEILPTIYSRVRRIEMKRLPDDVIADYLISKYSVDPSDAAALAHNAEGSVAKAVASLSTKGEDREFFDMFVSLMRLAYQRKVRELREWGATLAGWGRERELKFYEYCQRLIRENFIYNFGEASLNYMNRDETAFSRNFARFINERNVEKILEVMNKAMADIAGNANGKIVNFDLAIKIILLLKQ